MAADNPIQGNEARRYLNSILTALTAMRVGGAVVSGTAVIDFGDSFSDFASVFVPQSIIPLDAHVRVWLTGRTMSTNNANDHALLGLFSRTVTLTPSLNSGFEINILCLIGRAKGKFRLDWTWS